MKEKVFNDILPIEELLLKKHRKEVSLTRETIDLLEIKASKAGRLLKNYMEQVLIDDANKI